MRHSLIDIPACALRIPANISVCDNGVKTLSCDCAAELVLDEQLVYGRIQASDTALV